MEDLLSPTEFAFAIGKSERQIRRYMMSGKLNYQYTEAGARIPATELEKFVKPTPDIGQTSDLTVPLDLHRLVLEHAAALLSELIQARQAQALAERRVEQLIDELDSYRRVLTK